MGTHTTSHQKKKTLWAALFVLLPFVILCAVSALLFGRDTPGEESTVPASTAAPTAAPTAPPAEATATPGVKIVETTPEPTAAPTEAPTPEPTAAPAETPAPEPPRADAIPGAVGQYTYAAPEGDWILDLRENAVYTLTDPEGRLHTGESWTLQPDGTVECGPTDIYGAEFAFAGGCSRWVFTRGSLCFPVKNG